MSSDYTDNELELFRRTVIPSYAMMMMMMIEMIINNNYDDDDDTHSCY